MEGQICLRAAELRSERGPKYRWPANGTSAIQGFVLFETEPTGNYFNVLSRAGDVVDKLECFVIGELRG